MKLPLLLVMFSLVACGDNVTPPPERNPFEPAEPTPLECIPNLDDRIDAAELRAVLGVSLDYLVNPADTNVGVDLAGATDQFGVRVWDWSSDSGADQVLSVEATDLAEQWYVGSFPSGEFVSDLSTDGAFDAVYSQTDAGVFLHGFASPTEDAADGTTLVVYAEPVAIYRFPLEVGNQWNQTVEVRDGLFRGLPYAARDTYEFEVDGSGELWLPDFRVTNALRVRTRFVNEPAVGEGSSRLQASYLFECFGEVARAVSETNETETNFTSAAEVRRLGLLP